MKKFLLKNSEIEILRSLINTQISQIVWDINAFYFVLENSIVKLEVKDDKPETPEPFKYDEIFFLSVEKVVKDISFQSNGEEGLWYKVVGENEQILHIKIVRATVKFPEEILVNANDFDKNIGLNLVDCGILFYVKNGIIPAVMYENCFGFHTSNKFDVHTEQEIKSLLNNQYQITDLL